MYDRNLNVDFPRRFHFAERLSKSVFVTNFYANIGKRTFDIMLCVISLPIILSVLLVVWVVGQFNGGKVIFTQDRVGRNGKTFPCLKIRSMVCDADAALVKLCADDADIATEWEQFQKLKNDPRISRWGGFLRKSSIDELPQILNVLAGHMSIVGPRPFMTNQADMYRSAGGRHYFSMRPGITGPWQVSGRGNTTFLARIAFDRLYSKKLCFAEDLRLIGSTVKVLLHMNGK